MLDFTQIPTQIKIYGIYAYLCVNCCKIQQNLAPVTTLLSFSLIFRHAQLPYSANLTRPLNLKEDSEIAGKLRMANRVLKLAMDNLAVNFERCKNQFNSSKIPEIKEGSKLFVLTSQRNHVSFMLARKWTRPYICVKLLDHKNVLLKPLHGQTLIKVPHNLCKLVEERKEHICINETNPFTEQTKQPSSYLTVNDNVIEPNPGDDDEITPQPPVPPPPPPPPEDSLPPTPPPENPVADVSNAEEDDNNVFDHSFHSPPSSPPAKNPSWRLLLPWLS